MEITRGLAMALCVVLTSNTVMQAQTKERTIARLVWQDASDQSLKTGDLKRGQGWTLQVADVEGFPKLDAEQQSHVQMQLQDGIILSGVRDTQDGGFQSGWVAIDAGVTKESHGDHFHWRFNGSPEVIATRLDDQQGNPAHVYLYDGVFYLANDKKNGFTVVEPSLLRAKQGASADRFISAGGGHITLAAVGGQVVYATWIDREGENVGRVDAVRLDSNSPAGYRFQLPSGGIHGATTCCGKVFFAPSDGICWVHHADTSNSKQSDSVVVNHLTLGEDADGTPLRTGSFRVAGNHVLFNVGRGSASQLCIVDASSAKPTVLKIDMAVGDGNTITAPVVVNARSGEQFALLFEESRTGDLDEKLHVFALDPNRDGSFNDATLKTTLSVGRSLIEGHSGHHEVTAIGRGFVGITNPGDGTIVILSTGDWSIQATLPVGGVPTRLVAVGG